ncbi:MAG: queuosine precursor transporter [bacterium]|nr:queuosine precursor transporter [bacterium]
MTLEKKLDFLLAIYIGAIVSAELLGSKLINIFGIATSVGIYSLPLTFVINDIVSEVMGKPRARNFVRSGLVVLVILFFFVAIARILPPAGFYKNNDAYRTIFGNSMRVIIGSLTAFAISEFTDVYIFNYVRERWGKKFLWLRSNLSNFVSQFIDTTIFIFVAFYMASPASTVSRMWALIIPYFLLKVFFSVVETPFTYLGVKWLKNSDGDLTEQTNINKT